MTRNKNGSLHNFKNSINKEVVLVDQLMQKCFEYSSKTNRTTDELLGEFSVLSNLVEQIRKLQEITNEKVLAKKERSIRIKQFLNLCKRENLFDESKFEFSIIDEQCEQYGLKTLIDLKESDLMISIPRKYMLTNEDAVKDSNFGPLMKEDSILSSMPNVCLSLFVAEQKCRGSVGKGFDSFWRSYLEACPTIYSTTLFFNRDELDLLRPSVSMEQSVKMWRNICRQYAYFYQKMLNPLSKFSKLVCCKYFTFDLYRWAISVVMTRQNFIPSNKNENKMIDALIPLYDMLNHEQGKLSTDFDVRKDEAICYAMRDFKAGQELKIHYGDRSNADLLVYSGFVYENNANDYLMLKLVISKSDLLYAQKVALLNQLNISKSGSFKLRHKSKPIDSDLLTFLRVFHINEDELDHYLTSTEELNDLQKRECERFKVIDRKLEEFLSIRAKLMLRNYSIVTQELQSTRSLNVKNALLLVSLEKRILESYL